MDGKGKIGARLGRLFLALLIGLSTLGVIISLVGSGKVLKELAALRPSTILLLSLVSFLVMLVDSLRTWILSRGFGKKVRYLKALENSVLGFYVSALTPFSAGGQPFQIYHLTKSGMSVEEASAIVGIKFVTSFSVTVALGMVALFRYSSDIREVPYLGDLMYFGIALTVAMYVFFLFVAMGGRFAKFVISSRAVVYPMALLLRKDREELRRVVFEKVASYAEVVKELWRKAPGRFLANVFLSLAMILLILYTPYLSISSVSSEKLEVFKVMGLQVAMNMIVYFLPTPGASGGVEGVFYLVFSKFVSREKVVSALVLWRFFTYYLVIIVGNLTVARYLRSRTDSRR